MASTGYLRAGLQDFNDTGPSARPDESQVPLVLPERMLEPLRHDLSAEYVDAREPHWMRRATPQMTAVG